MSSIYFPFLFLYLGGLTAVFSTYSEYFLSFFALCLLLAWDVFFGVRYTTYSFNSGERPKAAQDFLFSFTVHSLESVRLLDGIWVWQRLIHTA